MIDLSHFIQTSRRIYQVNQLLLTQLHQKFNTFLNLIQFGGDVGVEFATDNMNHVLRECVCYHETIWGQSPHDPQESIPVILRLLDANFRLDRLMVGFDQHDLIQLFRVSLQQSGF